MKKILVVIGGPTASGKTELAIDLALKFNTVIVSADSRQFYRELNIGTAKPTAEELSKVKHYFINSHSIIENFNASDFGQQAQALLYGLFADHDIVIMAGGSGLYIDAAIKGLDDLPGASPDIRKHLEHIQAENGIEALQEMLRQYDPESYDKIDLNNARRLIRALEVTLDAGKPYSSLLGRSSNSSPWKTLMAGITHSREDLYNRINLRTKQMIDQGLREEALSVMEHRLMPSLQTVGYREMFDHIDGKFTIEETENFIAQHTRNYAKRQLTWFRKYEEMMWIDPGKTDVLIQEIRKG